jgi:hypothetical protein
VSCAAVVRIWQVRCHSHTLTYACVSQIVNEQTERLLHDCTYCTSTTDTRSAMIPAWLRSINTATPLTKLAATADLKSTSSSSSNSGVAAVDDRMSSELFNQYFAQQDDKAIALMNSLVHSLQAKAGLLHGSYNCSSRLLVTKKEHRRALYRLQRDLASTSKVCTSAIQYALLILPCIAMIAAHLVGSSSTLDQHQSQCAYKRELCCKFLLIMCTWWCR